MNSLIVGGILKRIYSDFDMLTFSNRLHLQKIIYLVQAHGINLGYTFSWYLHGPYSTELTRQAFNIDNFSNMKPIKFEDNDVEKSFEEFISKLGSNKNNDFLLEVASSIHLLRKMHPTKTKEQIIEDIEKKSESFKSKGTEIREVWKDIEGWLI